VRRWRHGERQIDYGRVTTRVDLDGQSTFDARRARVIDRRNSTRAPAVAGRRRRDRRDHEVRGGSQAEQAVLPAIVGRPLEPDPSRHSPAGCVSHLERLDRGALERLTEIVQDGARHNRVARDLAACGDRLVADADHLTGADVAPIPVLCSDLCRRLERVVSTRQAFEHEATGSVDGPAHDHAIAAPQRDRHTESRITRPIQGRQHSSADDAGPLRGLGRGRSSRRGEREHECSLRRDDLEIEADLVLPGANLDRPGWTRHDRRERFPLRTASTRPR